MRRSNRFFLAAAPAVVAAAALAPGTASAAVVSASGGVATYQAAPGEANGVFPLVVNGALQIRETNASVPLAAGQGCVIIAVRTAQCTGAGSTRVALGDGNDVYYGTGPGFTPAAVDGGPGNDIFFDGDGALRRETYVGGTGTDTANYFLTAAPVRLSLNGVADDGQGGEADFIASDVENLTGGQGADVLTGNDANNSLRGEGGADRLSGLGGNDFFEEGLSASGADLISGGAGTDRVRYAERNVGVRVSLDGAANDGAPGEGDNVIPDVEQITGSPQADVLIGSSLANTVFGLGGDDTINPLGGADAVHAGDGNDLINSRDGVRDLVRGDAGTDTFQRDLIDDVA